MHPCFLKNYIDFFICIEKWGGGGAKAPQPPGVPERSYYFCQTRYLNITTELLVQRTQRNQPGCRQILFVINVRKKFFHVEKKEILSCGVKRAEFIDWKHDVEISTSYTNPGQKSCGQHALFELVKLKC